MSTTRTQVHLTEDQRAKVDRAAAAKGLTMAEIMFDNDGTLWCECPNDAHFTFFADRLRSVAEADPKVGTRAEYAAVLSGSTQQ